MEIRTFKIKKKTFKCNKPWCRQQPPDPSHPPFLSPSSQGSSSWPDHHNGIPSVKFIYTIYNIHRAKLSQNVSKMNFHLHGAQDSESNMSTSNHSKTLFTREEGAAWNCSHRLLPRVDQVRINLRKSINNVLDFFCTKRN